MCFAVCGSGLFVISFIGIFIIPEIRFKELLGSPFYS